MGFDLRTFLLNAILSVPAILIGFTFHEYAHALVADKLGDKTPRFQGRLTLNPLAHVDLVGFLMILIFRFGYAKPVQINPGAFKNYYKDDLKVSIAGPIANLLVATIFAVIFGLISKHVVIDNLSITYLNIVSIIFTILKLIVFYNCLMFLFNLIPIPGFDGFHILRDIFPKAFYSISDTMYRYQMLILLLLVFPIIGGNSILGLIIMGPTDALVRFLLRLV